LAKLHGYVEHRLPDAGVPSERIRRLKQAKPGFISRREGWARFYRWQDWHGRRLKQMMRFNGA
jgi:hypothetical protein